jgi:hypothetical protein
MSLSIFLVVFLSLISISLIIQLMRSALNYITCIAKIGRIKIYFYELKYSAVQQSSWICKKLLKEQLAISQSPGSSRANPLDKKYGSMHTFKLKV